MKKILSILMSFVMLISITSGLNLTANAEILTGSCGDNVTYTLDTETGELVISGTGAMTDSWYSNRSSIKTVKINSGVTSIGIEAFLNCTSLTSVTIPDSVTSIGERAFSYCTSLTSVTIPDSVTSIGDSAFYYVKNIAYNGTATYAEYNENWGANARNGYVDGNLVYSDSSKTVLEGCGGSATGEIVIPDTVTKIDDYAFYNCTKIEKVTISDSVTSIGYSAFEYCTSLTSVTIPDGLTSIGSYAFYRVKNIAYNGTATSSNNWGANALNGYVDGNLVYSDSSKTVLEGCGGSATGEIVIPDTVTKIDDYAFENCTKIEKVTIPNSVTSIGNSAFSHCTSLTSVTIPDSVTSIGDSAFWYCTSLPSVTIPDSVTSIGNYAFSLVKNIAYNGTATGSPWGANALNGYVDGYFVYSDSSKTVLEGCGGSATGEIVIPDTVTKIDYYAFYNCTKIEKVTIPDSVTSIGGRAFFNCTSLASVTIGNGVTSIGGYAFYSCTSLTNVYYASTMANWNNIAIDYFNSDLANATIHCTDGTINGDDTPSTEPSTTPSTPNTTQPTTAVTQPITQAPVATTATPTTAAPTIATTAATTEAKPAGAKKIDGVWVNSKYKKPTVSKVTSPKKKQIKITWKRTSGVKGYEIQYSTSKKFTKKTTKKSTIKNNKSKKPSKTIKKLKSRKKYYVRVRSYKTVKVNGKNVKVYSKWSKVKSVKTK